MSNSVLYYKSVKGLTHMHSTRLNKYVDNIIREHHTYQDNEYFLDASTLCPSDKQEFVAEIIRHDSYENCGFEFLIEDKNREEIAALFSEYLLSLSDTRHIYKDGFMSALKQSADKYYQIRMQYLVDERIRGVQSEVEWAPNSDSFQYGIRP